MEKNIRKEEIDEKIIRRARKINKNYQKGCEKVNSKNINTCS